MDKNVRNAGLAIATTLASAVVVNAVKKAFDDGADGDSKREAPHELNPSLKKDRALASLGGMVCDSLDYVESGLSSLLGLTQSAKKAINNSTKNSLELKTEEFLSRIKRDSILEKNQFEKLANYLKSNSVLKS